MAGKHVFVDESKRGDYVVVVAAVSTGNLEATRRELRTLLLPGQRALHFKDEREGRRKKILARMVELPVTAGVYVRHGGDAVSARRACLEAIVEDLSGRAEVERMVLELADGDLAADKRTLYAATKKHGASFTYHHLRAPHEPILWVADGLAWAWSHGGTWRASAARTIENVITV